MNIHILILAILPTLATAEYIDYGRQPLGNVTRNGYGYGTSRDATGRPFHFAPGALGATSEPRRSHGAYIDWTEQPHGQIRRSTPGTYRDATGRVFHLEEGALGADD
jgi:hypothetical protein